ncbi:MAG: hypothetical protein BGO98_35720 [Myxococcales bacterium 68-20]|nr:MAG: hypothetical protein BGO98_35720 [Myxococcales bacterium 68-20]
MLPLAALSACVSSRDLAIGEDCDDGFCERAPALAPTPDASTEASTRELTNYCASNKCPTGFTTCPNSKFLCDVDLRSDPKNCGACGAACPQKGAGAVFDCLEGRCVMRCERPYLDCDGLIETGCETSDLENASCGACGNKCPETKPCSEFSGSTPTCGCTEPKSYCANAYPTCQDLRFSDEHCGVCDNACDRTGGAGAAPAPPNAYYGCGLGQCGSLKCEDGYADCNMDLGQPESDGCEVRLGSHENCVACGDNCRAIGMDCVFSTDFEDVGLGCRCPPGQNFCGISTTEPFFGVCADFASNAKNCGGCGLACPGVTLRSKGVCQYGTCKLECTGRWADCNGNVDDDCEVDTFSDPQNCGGCGITCDIAAGQACAGGRCVVEPCSGEVAQ